MHSYWITLATVAHSRFRWSNVCDITFTQAIYPTIIIVLVALNRSHIEKGFTHHLESLPTPHITVTVDTITASLQEGRWQEQSPILVIDAPVFRRGDNAEDSLNTGSSSKASWTRTPEK